MAALEGFGQSKSKFYIISSDLSPLCMSHNKLYVVKKTIISAFFCTNKNSSRIMKPEICPTLDTHLRLVMLACIVDSYSGETR